jgi:hypothetical protein
MDKTGVHDLSVSGDLTSTREHTEIDLCGPNEMYAHNAVPSSPDVIDLEEEPRRSENEEDHGRATPFDQEPVVQEHQDAADKARDSPNVNGNVS